MLVFCFLVFHLIYLCYQFSHPNRNQQFAKIDLKAFSDGCRYCCLQHLFICKILLQENMTEKCYILNETVKQHFFDKIS